ncbi:hypothetical protein ACHQM5_011922 [Ranunculus cassubicifolius]
MADAIVSMVLEQFTSYAQHEVELVVGVREEVRKLSVTLRMIQGVLEDAEQKQVKNNAVKVWLEELKGVLYDVDDVMDDWNTKTAISQLQRVDLDDNAPRRRKVLALLLSLFSCFKHVTVQYAIGHRVKEIGERLDDINTKRSQFGLVKSPSHDQPRLVTSSIIDVSIHGRDQDTKIIVNRLLGESSHQESEVQVIAIVGMGGFGKTTLAKLVLKEEGVVKNFEKKMWVCVSEPFDLFGVAKKIIEEAQGNVPSSIGWEAIHQCLCNSVKGIRFLLVLDDVWTKDPNHWNPLKVSLDGGAPGSRIIVTTRNEEVAKMMGSSHIHSVEKLSEGDSWSLLRDIVLKGRDDECRKFEKVGKEIANKCKGVPLALSTVAGLLRVKATVQNWRDILESDLWGLAQIEDFFLPSLFLSYFSLPSVSKQCFLYCSVFPKDTQMKKELLVKLWMAEGFLGTGRMVKLEKVGEDHFDNLAMRSFFQDFKKDSNGNITSCKMHDLVHDFAQYLSQGECSNNSKFDCEKVRYLYWEGIENSSLYEAKKLRTLIGYSRTISVDLFEKLPCLRVLDFGYIDLEELPEAVGKLVHLRYLDLSGNENLLELPESICNLYNLQTLRLNRCYKLEKLPEKIGRLSNLRHLEIESTDALHHLPQSIKRLSSLRTLSKFIVSQGCKIGDLKLLKDLGGALELKGLGRITDESDTIEADLKKKKDLRCLTFDWKNGKENDMFVQSDVAGAMVMLERLEPHEDLEELKMTNYIGSQFPCWFGNSLVLGNLVKMEFYSCNQITQLPGLGKLGSLESLKIFWMDSVKSIGREFYYGFDSSSLGGGEVIAFPKLKTLELRDMNELEKWELPINSIYTRIMPRLSSLKLDAFPELKALPCLGKLESLEELEMCGLNSIERLDLEISDYDESMPQEDQLLFPKLTKLRMRYMAKLEEWSVPLEKFEANTIMPSLRNLRIEACRRLRVLPDLTKFKSLVSLKLNELDSWDQIERLDSMPSNFTKLSIWWCPKLIEVPSYLFSPWLKRLTIWDCPQLSGLQCLPPLLERLWLDGDNGGYSKSIPLENKAECSINNFILSHHPHSSLPDGFKELKALRELEFVCCDSLDFELKELQHFTMLQDLTINKCPLLEERFQGDDWRSILPHVPKIGK